MITSTGAPSKPYIKSVKVNGKQVSSPVLTHADIASGGEIVFEMSEKPQAWASSTLVGVSRPVIVVEKGDQHVLAGKY